MTTNSAADVQSVGLAFDETESSLSTNASIEADIRAPENQNITRFAGEGSATEYLPPYLVETEGKTVDAALPEAARTNATLVHDALTSTNIVGFWTPNVETLKNILGSANEQERQQISQAYQEQYGSTLRADLDIRLENEVEFRTVEAILDRKDGMTNDAGNVRIALAVADSGDQSEAGRLLGAAVSTLNREQYSAMVQIFESRYGSFDEAINNSALDEVDRTLLTDFYSKGADGRTSADIVEQSQNLLNGMDSYLNEMTASMSRFYNVLGGNLPAAQEARAILAADPGFSEKYAATFQDEWRLDYDYTIDKVSQDLLLEGRISIATIAEGNSDTIFGLLNNPDNTALAVSTATKDERNKFSQGRGIALSGADPANAEEQTALEYYQKLHSAFERDGARRQSMLEDQMIYGGPTMISELAQSHNDGGWFGIGAGHDMNQLMTGVESMSEENWNLLSSPKTSAQFRADLDASLKVYTSDAERERILALVDRKAAADTFDASASVLRSLTDTIADNSEGAQLPTIANRVLSMTSEEASEYRANPERVNTAISQIWPGDEQEQAASLLISSSLTQMAETGAPAVLGPIEQYAKNVMDNGVEQDPTKRAVQIAQLLNDQEFVGRMARVHSQVVDGGMMEAAQTAPLGDLSAYRLLGGITPWMTWDNILDEDGLSTNGQVLYDFNLFDKYPLVADLPEEMLEQKRQFMDPAQLRILDNVLAQNGEMELEDRVRSMSIEDGGSYEEFQLSLSQMTPEEQQQIISDYQTKYQSNLVDDMLTTIDDENERAVLGHVANQNWQKQISDDLRLFITGKGGSYSDFESQLSQLTPEARATLLSEYSQKYGGNVVDEFVGLVPESHQIQYRNFFTPPDDGRQEYYERVADDPETGWNVDASDLTIDRVTNRNQEWLQEFQADKNSLPPDLQAALDDQFSEAFKQNADSQERLAQTVFDATVTAAAVGAMFFTGGVSAAALVRLMPVAASTAASYRLGVMANIQGDHFDLTAAEAAKEAAIAAVYGALVVAPMPKLKAGGGVGTTLDDAAAAAAGTVDNAAATTVDDAGAAAASTVDNAAPLRGVDEAAPVTAVDEAAPVTAVDEAAPVTAVDEAAPVTAVDEAAPVAALDDAAMATTNAVDNAAVATVDEAAAVVSAADNVVPAAANTLDDAMRTAATTVDEVIVQPLSKSADEAIKTLTAILAPLAQSAEDAVKTVNAILTPIVQGADDAVRQINAVIAPYLARAGLSAQPADDVTRAINAVVEPLIATARAAAKEADLLASAARVTAIGATHALVNTFDQPEPEPVDELSQPLGETLEATKAAAIPEAPIQEEVVPEVVEQPVEPEPEIVAAPEPMPEPEPEPEPDPEPEMQTITAPSEEFIALGRVGDGEGYWQSAERIMSASAQEFDNNDVLELSNTLQKVYADEHADDMLMSGYRFITQDRLQVLLNEVDNETVRSALLDLSSQQQVPVPVAAAQAPVVQNNAVTPTSELTQMAVVQPGEGFWHVAGRVVDAKLSEDNTYDTYHAGVLVEVMQQMYRAEHGENAILQPNVQLITSDNFVALLNAVKDDEVKALLMEYAAQENLLPD